MYEPAKKLFAFVFLHHPSLHDQRVARTVARNLLPSSWNEKSVRNEISNGEVRERMHAQPFRLQYSVAACVRSCNGMLSS